MRTSKYIKEFKDSTVQLALNSDEAVSKIAADLGYHSIFLLILIPSLFIV